MKFFNLLEDTCHQIDVKIAGHLALQNKTIDKSAFDEYISQQREIRQLEYIISDLSEKIDLVHDAIATNLIRTPEKEEDIRNMYTPRLKHLQDKKDVKV